MNQHTDYEWDIIEPPTYTLFRVEGEGTDWTIIPTTYTIVCDYGKGNINIHAFENIDSAFRCFRMMVGLEII